MLSKKHYIPDIPPLMNVKSDIYPK